MGLNAKPIGEMRRLLDKEKYRQQKEAVIERKASKKKREPSNKDA